MYSLLNPGYGNWENKGVNFLLNSGHENWRNKEVNSLLNSGLGNYETGGSELYLEPGTQNTKTLRQEEVNFLLSLEHEAHGNMLLHIKYHQKYIEANLKMHKNKP